MPTIRQLQSALRAPSTGRVSKPRTSARTDARLRLVKSGISAIQYIVETARPGEVTHIDEADYYNPHLWRKYQDF